MIGVGMMLPPDLETLVLLEGAIERADYFEVAPETLWVGEAEGDVRPNGYYQRFVELREAMGKPFVAHGVGLSAGTLDEKDDQRFEMWLDRLERTHTDFDFAWSTDHSGASILDGRDLVLPLPLPMTDAVAQHVRGRLQRHAARVGSAGLENAVTYFQLGDPLDEPAFLRACVDAPNLGLVLDLHNVFTMSVNHGFDPHEYLARFALERVVEVHLSGGAESEPAWLGGRVMRLDSHDHSIPETVWELARDIVPRCAGLRGITIERMEGTLTRADIPAFEAELERASKLLS